MSDLIQNPEDIRLTDREEIEAIMGHPPGWLLRSGNIGIMAFIVLLLVFGFYYKYPDVVQTRVELMSDSPPLALAPLKSGRMVFLTEKDTVSKDDLIAVLENPANLEDVNILKKELEILSDQLSDNDLPKSLKHLDLELGNLQSEFSELNHWLDAFARFRKRDRTSQKISNLQKQIARIDELNEKLEEERMNLKASYETEKTKFDRVQKMVDDSLAAKVNLDDAKINLLSAEREEKSISSKITANEIRKEELRKSVLELKDSRSTTLDDNQLKAETALQNLKGSIEVWEQQNLIIAPIAGQLYRPKIMNEDQFLEQGVEIFTIIPGHQNIYGRALVGQDNFGKIKEDMVVKLRLLSYPYQDFGAVNGRIAEIDPIPEDELYGMRIEIPEENIIWGNDKLYLRSTFGDSLEVGQKMVGIGNVITKKRTFLERIFTKLRATWDD